MKKFTLKRFSASAASMPLLPPCDPRLEVLRKSPPPLVRMQRPEQPRIAPTTSGLPPPLLYKWDPPLPPSQQQQPDTTTTSVAPLQRPLLPRPIPPQQSQLQPLPAPPQPHASLQLQPPLPQQQHNGGWQRSATVDLFVKTLSPLAFPLQSVLVGAVPHHIVRSPINFVVAPGDSVLLRTDLALLVPLGYFGTFFIINALATWAQLALDSRESTDRTGNVVLRIFNQGAKPYTISRGDAVGLLRVERCSHHF